MLVSSCAPATEEPTAEEPQEPTIVDGVDMTNGIDSCDQEGEECISGFLFGINGRLIGDNTVKEFQCKFESRESEVKPGLTYYGESENGYCITNSNAIKNRDKIPIEDTTVSEELRVPGIKYIDCKETYGPGFSCYSSFDLNTKDGEAIENENFFKFSQCFINPENDKFDFSPVCAKRDAIA